MKLVIKIISYSGLCLTLIPSILVFLGSISLDTAKSLMVLGMVLWFPTSHFWMNKNSEQETDLEK